MEKFRNVLVEYEDIVLNPDWVQRKVVMKEEKPFIVRLVGFLIKVDKRFIILANRYSEDEDKVGGYYVIPRGSIRKMNYLLEMGPVKMEEKKDEV